jgi:hypothetical protein
MNTVINTFCLSVHAFRWTFNMWTSTFFTEVEYDNALNRVLNWLAHIQLYIYIYIYKVS